MEPDKSPMPNWYARAYFASFLAILILLLLYYGGHTLEKNLQKPMPRGDITLRYGHDDLLEINGKKYRRCKDVTAVLLLGVDSPNETEISPYRSGGQADFLYLLIIDNNEKCISRIQINRDTLAPVTILGVLGHEAGIRSAQISLAHGFGKDEAQRCKLTMEAVARLLGGIKLDGYLSLNMGGITRLNDLVGGVTVTLKDDFTRFDPVMTTGAILTLKGRQAEYYLRGRIGIGDGTNTFRMERQKIFMSALIEKMQDRTMAGMGTLVSLYDGLSDCITSSFSRGRLINGLWGIKDYTWNDPISLPAEDAATQDGFPAVTIDESFVMDTLIRMLYKELPAS